MQLITSMIPLSSLCILPLMAIQLWWVILPTLLLLAIAIQLWVLFETRRMKSKIEQILDLTVMGGGQDEVLADAESAVSGDDNKLDSDTPVPANIQDSEYSIETLRMKLGISRSGLYKKLIYLTGRSPLEYLRIKRLQMGRAMLENGETSVSQIAWSVGFSPKQFSKYFKDEYGCLPSEFIHYISD